MLELIWVATVLAIGVVGGIITENLDNREKAKAEYKKQWERKMRGTTLDCRYK